MQIGSKSASRSKKRQKFSSRNFVPMSEINVTPFVDIMLVLLIIFMVAAPLLSVGIEVDLPTTKAKGGILFVTTAPEPIIEYSPIIIPHIIVAFAPILTDFRTIVLE